MRTITIPLSQFVSLLLGDNHYRPIELSLAQQIAEAASGTEICHVQFYERDGTRLKYPVLWSLHHWRISTDSWLAAKERSDRERDERFVLEENIKRVVRVLHKETGIEGDGAYLVARKMLKAGKFKQLSFLGVNNLAKTIEDI